MKFIIKIAVTAIKHSHSRHEISLDYESYEAPCMNGDPHDYSPTITAPKWATKMRCSHCEKERPLTEDEKTKHSIPPIPEEYLS